MPKSLYSPLYTELIERLISARRKAGLTQTEVASRLERPQSFVAKYEKGERRIDAVELIAIADALNVSPLTLFAALVRSAKKLRA